MENNCSTESIAKAVREYAGVRRKHAIGEIIHCLKLDSDDVLVSFGEDAALIKNNDDGILLAADGIWSMLMEADPYWAGFCSVLVNVHDIAAMGGRPLAMVDILSIQNEKVCHEVLRGMADASKKFNVPVVGGHLHPDSEFSAIDVAIMGIVKIEDAIFSHTAKASDRVIAAIDLNGRIHPSCALNWDSATLRSAQEVRDQINVMQKFGAKHLLTAGKDISNPGVIGTLGMLLESSEAGAEIELSKIPRPDLFSLGITFSQWVRMYPGMGFIVTAKEENVAEVISMFNNVGITASEIGVVNDTRHLSIKYNDKESSVFDLRKEGIMGLFD
ncbi:methanogenesis marker 2 protein [Methanomicrobium antiquum]|uniref:Methanogenesis marker 2 protein n=1 Tax=Methanomicrobium antiquum TaxID=487686 RepID=A0AAF0FPI4_9EURY|nr:methanogenesis marker 2 protein [Methanomicrobium antiquum]MDD3976675.1 methanogenesis marker 2 protein [Methanomicrobium sp.]WFN37290.1 methanogenesis marker 2 protein [Methanomicrobium antiquum]